jgi:hypothetical protein
VVTCYIVLEPGSFSALNGGNAFAAIKDGIVWSGETAEFDKNGKVIAAYLGSQNGSSSAVGDNLVNSKGSFSAALSANPLSVTAFVPRLAGTSLRLNGAKVDESVFAVLNKALGTSLATPAQSGAGVYTLPLSSLVYTQPSKRVRVDTSRADGISQGPEGTVEVAAGGYIVTFAPALKDPQAFADQVAKALPGAVSELRWNGTWQVKAADGSRYITRPTWITGTATSGDPTFVNAANGSISFNYGGVAQTLLPDFHDYDTALATFRSALQDNSLTLQPQVDGTVTATLGNKTFHLTPQWSLLPLSNPASQPAWWVDNGVIYLKNADGSAQGFTVK